MRVFVAVLMDVEDPDVLGALNSVNGRPNIELVASKLRAVFPENAEVLAVMPDFVGVQMVASLIESATKAGFVAEPVGSGVALTRRTH